MPFPIPNRSFTAALTAGVLVLALAACTPPNAPSTGASPAATSGLPSTHIHGLTVSGDSSQVLMATHDGLFDVTKEPAMKIGATNDLMGFTPGKDQGSFYASGHPGPGSDLPEPLGLMKSSDGGKTWEPLSRQGESDFHALTTTRSGIIAYDAELRTSPDGKTWKTVAAGFAPAALAGHPDSDTVLATTQEGVQRSTDGGNTWTLQKTLENNDVVFVDFWAGWCSPCRMFAPTYQAASENHPDITFAKVDTEAEEALAAAAASPQFPP